MFKMRKTLDLAAQTVTFSAIGQNEDKTEKVLFSEVFELAKVKPEILLHLALHGASQKGGDSYAGAGADDVADPLAYTQEAVKDTIKQLYDGNWKVAGTGGPRVSDLAVAVSQITGQTVEEITAVLDQATDEQRKAMRKEPTIAAKLAENAAAKAAERAKALAAKAGEKKAEGGFDLGAFMAPKAEAEAAAG